MPFAPLLFACTLVSDIYIYIYIGPAFTDFLQNIGLETSSPPVASVHQDDNLTYALETLNYFFCYSLLLAWEPATLY